MKLKRMIKILGICFFLLYIVSPFVVASSQEEILQSQSDTLNIKDFVSKANEYTKETFGGVDAGTLLNEAISGKIDNQTLISKIFSLFGKEIKETIKIIRKHYCHCCYS